MAGPDAGAADAPGSGLSHVIAAARHFPRDVQCRAAPVGGAAVIPLRGDVRAAVRAPHWLHPDSPEPRSRTAATVMDAYWRRRYVVALLVALTMAAAAAMVSLGTLPLPAESPEPEAFAPRWSAIHVVASLAIVPAALWGALALRRTSWSQELARPMRAFFQICIPAGLAAATYHAWGSPSAFVLGHGLMAAAHLLLLASVLVERLDARFGSPAAAVAVFTLAGLGVAYAWTAAVAGDHLDVRPLRLLQILPALLVPAGALSLSARHLGRRDWLTAFALFVVAVVCDGLNGWTLSHWGWPAGHALSHTCLAAATGWLAYCAAASALPQPPPEAAAPQSASSTSRFTRSW